MSGITKEQQERLIDLRGKLEEKNDRAVRLEREIAVAKMAEKNARLVAQSVAETPEGTSMYRAVGKLFLFTPGEEMKASLEAAVTERAEQVQKLSISLNEAQRDLDAAKATFRDEVQRLAPRA